MRIEGYIKDLLFDFDKVVIPGFGAFVGTEQFAYINEATQQIHPPLKQISFNNKLQLDDGILISKIEEEQHINKEAAIESVQHFVEQLSNKLAASKFYSIDGLGILSTKEDASISFQQDKSINYFVDAYGLQPVDLPERIRQVGDTEDLSLADNTIESEEDAEALLIEDDETESTLDAKLSNLAPHADKEILEPDILPQIEGTEMSEPTSYELIEADTVDVENAQYKSKLYSNEQLERDYSNSTGEEEEDRIASGFDEYVGNTDDNNQIEAEKVEVTTDERKAKKGFSLWFLLLPLLLLMGAGYLLFTLMGKTENPYAKDMPKAPTTEIDAKSTAESKAEKTVKNEKDGLSSNSTAALLKTKEEKKNTKKIEPKQAQKAVPVKPKTSNPLQQLAKGYYIIISSTKSKKEAQVEAQKWMKRNYSAFVLPGPNNYNRIGIYTGTDKTVAEQKLVNYKTEIISSAWILKY